jgi:hypothetical protein
MRAPPPPSVVLAAVAAFQRRASAQLLQSPEAGTMSLANLSRTESMSGERQGWPFGLSWAARLDRSAAALLQCSKRSSRWLAKIPGKSETSTGPAGVGLKRRDLLLSGNSESAIEVVSLSPPCRESGLSYRSRCYI